MLSGAHIVIYSHDAEADRRFFRDVLQLPNVDVGDGWLIFALPPAEIAFHPSESSQAHELYLMCDDIEGMRAESATHGIESTDVSDEGRGLRRGFRLPDGAIASLQLHHARPGPWLSP